MAQVDELDCSICPVMPGKHAKVRVCVAGVHVLGTVLGAQVVDCVTQGVYVPAQLSRLRVWMIWPVCPAGQDTTFVNVVVVQISGAVGAATMAGAAGAGAQVSSVVVHTVYTIVLPAPVHVPSRSCLTVPTCPAGQAVYCVS